MRYEYDHYLEKENTCMNRLKSALVGKQYLPNEIYAMHLRENNLEPDEIYDNATMRKRLYKTVYNILDDLSNNINLYMKIETEFTTIDAAYNSLEKRLKNLKNKLDAMPDDLNDEQTTSNVVSLFYNSMSRGDV